MNLYKNLLAVTVLATVMTPARSQYIPSQDPFSANRDDFSANGPLVRKDIFTTGKGFPDQSVSADGVNKSAGRFSADKTVGVSSDSIPRTGAAIDWNAPPAGVNKPFPFKSLILPGAMIAYGFAAEHSSHLTSLNRGVKEEMWTDNPHKRLGIDTYLMFAPGAMVYGLNLAGIHGKHDFKDRTMLYLMSSLFANTAVFSLKSLTHELRPDGSNYNSFPSGHTAEAFASAEFMRQEYKDVSPWYGVAGYAMATATGMLRMYNDKHWLNDVIAGAGFGMASTRLAYWLYPVLQRKFGKGRSLNTVVMPTYQSGSLGLALAHHF